MGAWRLDSPPCSSPAGATAAAYLQRQKLHRQQTLKQLQSWLPQILLAFQRVQRLASKLDALARVIDKALSLIEEEVN
jgi:hypothetical protein